VCACLDGGLGLRPWHDGGSSASVGCTPRSPAHRPVKGGGPSEIAKGVEYFPQAGNNLWETRSPSGFVPFGSPAGPASAGREGDAGSSMEGTSGAADLGLLRGRTGDAALAPRVSAQATHGKRWPPRAPKGASWRAAVGGLAQARPVRGSMSSYPSRGRGLTWWDRSGQGSDASLAWQRPASPAGGATVSRQEVSERIGLG
jgi:hypothetical protein